MCTHQMAALFYVKWRVASILTVSRQVENPTALVDEYILEKHYGQISSRFDLKQLSFRLFLKRLPEQEEEDHDA